MLHHPKIPIRKIKIKNREDIVVTPCNLTSSMEEDARVFTKPHLVQQHYYNAQFQANPNNRGKSCSHFFLKFLFFALLLCLIPLFPSEPPEFITDTIFAKTWELIHLLIIGIALSYGLFCRPKTPQVQPKTQISQPFAPDILHHSSLFDYEERTPPGVSSDRNAIPTQSFNLSHYREEPVAVSRPESSRNFDDKPLGLPVRSLRSRVVDSDSEELEEEENCASESDSDVSGSNSSSASEKDEILEGNVGNSSPMLSKSQSMRGDFFMPENGKFEGNQPNFESFRSTVPAANQRFSGFCSWLPDSPNNMNHSDNWRGNNVYMPFSDYNQANGFNMVGMSPNFQNTSNFFMPPPAAVHPPMPFPATDFASNSRKHSHENEQWANANFVNGIMSMENSGFFMPSTAVPSSMPVPTSEFASRSRQYNHETENWSKSPNLQNNNLGGNLNFFMPSTVLTPAMPASADASASSVEALKNPKFNHEFSLEKKDEMRSEINNVALSGENFSTFMPSAVSPPSMPALDDNVSYFKASKNAKFNHGLSFKKKDEMRLDDINVSLGGENINTSTPSAVFPHSKPASADDNASSIKTSRNAKFNHGSSNSSFKKKGEMSSEKNNVDLGRKNDTFSPSMPAPANDSSSSIEASKNTMFNHRSSLKKKDEMRSESSNSAFGGDNKNFPMSSAAFPPSMPASTNDIVSLTKASKSTNFNHGSSHRKKEEMRLKNNNVAVKSFQEAINSSTPPSDDLLSGGKTTNIEDENLGVEKANLFTNETKVLPSVPSPINESSSLIQKDEKIPQKENVGSFEEKLNPKTPHFVDPFPFPSPRADVPPKKNKQTSIPEKWGDDCFVIPSSENNDKEDVLLENLPPLPTDSPERPSSERSSSRLSSHGQVSPQNKVDEHVPWSTPTNNSEIENVIEDVLEENESYKPSTPSPPPQLQIRMKDLVTSSVESSSRALGNQSFLNDDDDDLGSPPTPERRKTLSRASHSRRFSCGFFDRDPRKSFKDEVKGINRKTKGDDNQFARVGMCGWDCLKLDVKPTSNKASLKGKSVRTIRPKETPQDRQKNEQTELKREEYSKGLPMLDGGERKDENQEMVVIKIGISEKRSNSNGKKGEKLRESDGTTAIVVGLSSKQNSNSNANVPFLNDVKEEGNDSEIDRKADEFIAKFKQQIRLQKVGPRGDPSRQHKKTLYQA